MDDLTALKIQNDRLRGELQSCRSRDAEPLTRHGYAGVAVWLGDEVRVMPLEQSDVDDKFRPGAALRLTANALVSDVTRAKYGHAA